LIITFQLKQENKQLRAAVDFMKTRLEKEVENQRKSLIQEMNRVGDKFNVSPVS